MTFSEVVGSHLTRLEKFLTDVSVLTSGSMGRGYCTVHGLRQILVYLRTEASPIYIVWGSIFTAGDPKHMQETVLGTSWRAFPYLSVKLLARMALVLWDLVMLCAPDTFLGCGLGGRGLVLVQTTCLLIQPRCTLFRGLSTSPPSHGLMGMNSAVFCYRLLCG